MSDPTPILRADALDDDLQHEDDLPGVEDGYDHDPFAVDEEALKKSPHYDEWVKQGRPTAYATGGPVTGDGSGDALPEMLRDGCCCPMPEEWECYENGEGGWSYKRYSR